MHVDPPDGIQVACFSGKQQRDNLISFMLSKAFPRIELVRLSVRQAIVVVEVEPVDEFLKIV